jgi:hypothetical protein
MMSHSSFSASSGGASIPNRSRAAANQPGAGAGNTRDVLVARDRQPREYLLDQLFLPTTRPLAITTLPCP